MEKRKLSKRIGTIQIDTDGLWVIFQHFGLDYRKPQDTMYESSLPRFLQLFDAFGIKATFFVVGKDLFSAPKVELLKEVLKNGHEIANHSMTHREGFSFLSFNEKKQEIEDAEHIIQDKLGVTPKGFRTPSNDVDSEVLKILEDRGYLYDSSLMPTFYGPLIKRLKFGSLEIPRRDHYLGRFQYGLSPLTPYHPSSERIWRKGTMKIIEVPITTMPVLRFPFHASFTFAAYHFGFGCSLFNMGYALLSLTPLPLNFVFHTNELSDPIYESAIKRQYGLNLPLAVKEKICNQILASIKKNFVLIPTADYVRNLSKDEK